MLIMHAGEQVLALHSDAVIEIIPLIQMRAVPKTEDHLAGLIDYRGTLVPVIDLPALLIGRVCKRLLSSRIVLTRFVAGGSTPVVIGILAEGVTGTSEVDPERLSLIPEDFAVEPYLGKVARVEEGMAHEIRVDRIIGTALYKSLFGAQGLCKISAPLDGPDITEESEGDNRAT